MSSYDSNRSGYLHPQYHQQQAPPYPTTPGAPASQPQQQPFYPIPGQQQPQQQSFYSSSPTFSQPFYSSSPTSQPLAMMPPGQPTGSFNHRRSSSSASSNDPRPGIQQVQPSMQPMPMPIPIRQSVGGGPPDNSSYYRAPPSSWPGPQPVYGGSPSQQMQMPPTYARSASHAGSHHNGSMYGNGEEKYEGSYVGPIDEETEREYERRYAREKREARELESRPTLGGSLMSMMGKLGRTFGGNERR